MAPTVTIVVPTYDRPDLLAESIASAIAQTYQDWVLIVGDNGGSPRNESVVRGFGDPRVHYVRQPPGLGPQDNWLDLVARAESPVIGTLHDDDTWRPEFLEKAVPPLLEDQTLSMVFTDYWVVDGDGELWPEYTEELCHRTHRDRIPAGRVTGTMADCVRLVAVWNAAQPAFAGLVRRDAIMATEFPDEIAPIYDLWLSFTIVSRGEGLYFVPERLTNYRVWDQSITAADPISQEDEIFRRIRAGSIGLGSVVDELDERWADLRYGRAGRLMARREDREASRHELREAAPHLHGLRRVLAETGARSAVGWEALRFGRELAHRGPSSVRSWIKGRNAAPVHEAGAA